MAAASPPSDAHYRHVLSQMQREFARATTALEKQVTALTRHNALLTTELQQVKQQHEQQQDDAKRTDEAHRLEVTALKTLLQQEQEYWTRWERASREDRDRWTQRVAQATAETMQLSEQKQTLQREVQALQSRAETAEATSASFEQRLVVVVQEQQQRQQAMESQLTQYRQKVHEKRAQIKYLTEALVRLQERREGRDDATEVDAAGKTRTKLLTTRTRRTEGEHAVASASATAGAAGMMPSVVFKPRMETGRAEIGVERRVRKRELTLPEEVKVAAANVTTASRMYKSKRMGSSRAGTSPTSSSPEMSPRLARSAPYRRPPSVATTTPTALDGNSFNSSNGSLRHMRSLRHVTGRRISSRSSSDSSDSVEISPRTDAARHRDVNPTGRLERELSGLRRKLDSCMADATARW
uniref:Casein kinase II subunit beta n=1 Tax=Peronospora matthiolae TaxID=2874970 RepID=A0AAV1UL24_9STRA